MSILIRGTRLVGIRSDAPTAPVDLLIEDDRIVAVGRGLAAGGAEVVDAAGSWAIPGLWDAHTHLTQWGQAFGRLDTSGTDSPAEVLDRLAAHLPTDDSDLVIAFGHSSARWSQPATVSALDAVAGGRAVVLVSGDCHAGWLSSAAQRMLDVAPTDSPLEELDWFEVNARLIHREDMAVANELGVARAVAAAQDRGVAGVTELEFAPNYDIWPRRETAGVGAGLRVRAAVYPDRLAEVLTRGLRTGDRLSESGLITMGPLKIISDGSLNTRTAACCEPYAHSLDGTENSGTINYSLAELEGLLGTARGSGLRVALHAIGDAAVEAAVEAFARTGATGVIEHAQLVRLADIERMAGLRIDASVQPAHLLDDRDVTVRNWPDRQDRVFAFRSMIDAGVRLHLGSDCPVAPLDPWLAMAVAVHRSGDARPPWHPEQAITAREALAASVDGADTLAAGSVADLVLLDRDPTIEAGDSAETAARIRSTVVHALWVAGRRVR